MTTSTRCGKGPLKDGVAVYRVNPKGERGIWACEKHRDECGYVDHDSEVDALTEVIQNDKRKH